MHFLTDNILKELMPDDKIQLSIFQKRQHINSLKQIFKGET